MRLPTAFPIAGASFLALTAGFVACRSSSAPAPTKDAPPPIASAAVTASVTASAAAVQDAPPERVPTLVPEEFHPAGTHLEALYPVEGALVVVEGQRVGRIVGEGVEWVEAKIPKGSAALGDNIITSVQGRWPDGLDVLYTSSNGRALAPTFWPLTGKGGSHTVAGGGGLGWIAGVGRVGETTLVAGWSPWSGVEIVTVRGPKLARLAIPAALGGCKEGEVWSGAPDIPPAAIVPSAFGSSPEGTLVSLGRLCEKRGPAAEIWDKSGKSRIVDLSSWAKEVGDSSGIVPGKGDELWLLLDGDSPILHYKDGKFEPLPRLNRPAWRIFASPSGQLHAFDGRTIHRYDGTAWIPIGELPWSTSVRSMAIENDTLWVGLGSSVNRLRKGPAVAFRDDCKTPFVYLYDVSASNKADFTFPTTRKALSSFAGVSELGLVEFHESGARRLGLTVSGKAQGEAVIAHLKATMKDEHPKLLCYEPKAPRKIELKPDGK